MKKYDDVIINIEVDEPSRSSPALGQIDKLLRQSALETQSLQVVRRMLMRDMLDKASVTGISKLTAAAGLRQQQRKELPPATMNGHAKPKAKTYGSSTRRQEELAKTNITGPRLNLFLLEHLSDSKFTTGQDLMRLLKETGKADHVRILSGVFGMLTGERLIKRDPTQGYRLTASGKTFTKSLRNTLEKSNQIIPGEYVAPENYHKSTHFKMGFKTMGRQMKARKQA